MKTRSLLFALAMLVASCTADRNANPRYTGCATNDECGEDELCASGFCVPGGMDAGSPRDGGVDAGPPCTAEDACYEGDPATRNEGVCADGCRQPAPDGGFACVGQVLPADEEVCNGRDDDCNGNIDEGFTFDTPDQCGSCGNACAAGDTCCPDADTFECANLASSARFCGSCSTRCLPGEACCGSTCAAIATDEANCGACGNACGAGQDCCDGRCVDTSSSLAHCSGCGNACSGTDVCCPADVPPNAIGCRAEDECLSCDPACTGGMICCGGACTDGETDEANCGMCGNACAAGELCCGGMCRSPAEACGDCTTMCSGSEQCCGGSCVSRTSTSTCGACDVTCAPGQACCESGCSDTTTDPANCGACGNACVGEICSDGHCCPAGQIWCGTGCIVPNTNANCGACGRTCPGGLSLCNCASLGGDRYGCRNGLTSCG